MISLKLTTDTFLMPMTMTMSMSMRASDFLVVAADHVADTGPDARTDQGAGVGTIVAAAQHRGDGEEPGNGSCQCSAMAT